MKNQITHNDYNKGRYLSRQRLLFFSFLFLVLYSFHSNAQTTGIAISWNNEVGCQTYGSQDTSIPRDKLFLEDILDGQCLRVCENTVVTYTLSGVGATPNTQWTVSGGTFSTPLPTNTTSKVSWGAAGEGNITFSLNTPNGIVTKTLCIEIIKRPDALFTVAPNSQYVPSANVCSNQTINFTNLSLTNGGTALVSHYWDFGDGTSSTAFEPNHVFANPGVYNVTLTVTNACNCSASRTVPVTAARRGFDIICPSVVCEKQTVTYSLPIDGRNLCNNSYNWSVVGGAITAQADGNVSVYWNQVDNSGFGYVTFNPSACAVECPFPTTIKVPVIKAVGTITGNGTICTNEYERYVLPKWPTTDFSWTIINNTTGASVEIIPADHRNEVVIRATQQGTFTLRATYINTLLHCGGYAEYPITVGRTVAFSGPDIACQGPTSTAVYSTDDGLPVTWTFKKSTGGTTTTLANNSTFTTPYLTATGSYTITVSGAGICPGQIKTLAVIAVPATPAMTVNPANDIICPGAPYTYAVLNPDANSQYTWLPTGGTIIGSAIGNEVTVKFTGAGPFAIGVYRESLAPISCKSPTYTKTLQLQQINAEILNANTTVCGNSYANYQANFAGTANLYNEGESYEWIITPANLGSITSGQGTNAVTVLWNNVTGTVGTLANLQVKITKCNLPVQPFNLGVTIFPVPALTISNTPATLPICGGSSIAFTVTGSPALNPGTLVNWDFGNGNVIVGGTTAPPAVIFNNTTLANIDFPVKATIISPNGCLGTSTVTKTITVKPSPTASLTATNSTFCGNAAINATLTATTNGTTVEWYKSGTFLTTQTVAPFTLNVTPAMDFGSYYFIAYKSGCSTISNIVTIVNACGGGDPGPGCPTFTGNLVNNSSKSCNPLNLTLTGTASPTPTSVSFRVNGPGIPNLTYPNPTSLSVVAGVYDTYLNAVYGSCTYTTYKQVVVPYVVNFNYTVSCVGNNFNFSLFDNTNFLSTVQNKKYKYYISTDNITFNLMNGSSGPNYSLPNFPSTVAYGPGTYYLKLEVTGDINAVAQTMCSKTITVVLSPAVAPIVTYNTPSCYNTPITFHINNPQAGDTYSWLFEPGATNLLQEPVRVFSATGSLTVQLTVKNKYGCEKPYGVPITIPAKCFNGDNISVPTSATVCKGSPVTIKYAPGLGECGVTLYTLMNGKNLVNTSPTNGFQVYDPGFYWIKVTNGTCTWETSKRITPAFISLPSVKIKGPTIICEGETASLTAITNANSYSWKIDGSAPQFANTPNIDLTGLTVGSHTVILTGWDTTTPTPCAASITQYIDVAATPAGPSISFQLLNNDCAAYKVKLTATASGSGTFNWSNGVSGTTITGNTITVTDGGPYQVKYTNLAGCSATAQVDVPKNPEDYFWIFPSGCYTTCNQNSGTLIGPNVLLTTWAWMFNSSPAVSGAGSFMSPYTITPTGVYNMQLNTGLCNKTSLPLTYTQAAGCQKCATIAITPTVSVQNVNFCSYTVTLNITTGGTVGPVTITSPTNQVIISPASFTVGASGSNYTFTMIPINGFTGGTITLLLNGKTTTGINCVSDFPITLPACGGGGSSKTALTDKEMAASASKLTLYPNPAKNEVNIAFDQVLENTQLEIYDLTGRLIATYHTTTADGNWQLPLHNMATGVYVVVMKSNSQIVMQKKLQVL